MGNSINNVSIRTQAVWSMVSKDYTFSTKDLEQLMTGEYVVTQKVGIDLGFFSIGGSVSSSGERLRSSVVSGDILADIEALLELEKNKQIVFGSKPDEREQIYKTLTGVVSAAKKGVSHRDYLADRAIDCFKSTTPECMNSFRELFK